MKKTIDTAMFAIEAIVAEVENSWLAADGGLTEAACDVRRIGNNAIAQLKVVADMGITEENLIHLYWSGKDWYDSSWNCSTGAETDICCIMHRTLCTEAANERIWERWRNTAGALPGETPRALIARMYAEGKRSVLLAPDFPCPPDREISDWDYEVSDLVAEWDEKKYKLLLGASYPYQHIFRVHGFGLWDKRTDSPYIPEFSGKHYRRAAAMGIKL